MSRPNFMPPTGGRPVPFNNNVPPSNMSVPNGPPQTMPPAGAHNTMFNQPRANVPSPNTQVNPAPAGKQVSSAEKIFENFNVKIMNMLLDHVAKCIRDDAATGKTISDLSLERLRSYLELPAGNSNVATGAPAMPVSQGHVKPAMPGLPTPGTVAESTKKSTKSKLQNPRVPANQPQERGYCWYIPTKGKYEDYHCNKTATIDIEYGGKIYEKIFCKHCSERNVAKEQYPTIVSMIEQRPIQQDQKAPVQFPGSFATSVPSNNPIHGPLSQQNNIPADNTSVAVKHFVSKKTNLFYRPIPNGDDPSKPKMVLAPKGKIFHAVASSYDLEYLVPLTDENKADAATIDGLIISPEIFQQLLDPKYIRYVHPDYRNDKTESLEQYAKVPEPATSSNIAPPSNASNVPPPSNVSNIPPPSNASNVPPPSNASPSATASNIPPPSTTSPSSNASNVPPLNNVGKGQTMGFDNRTSLPPPSHNPNKQFAPPPSGANRAPPPPSNYNSVVSPTSNSTIPPPSNYNSVASPTSV